MNVWGHSSAHKPKLFGALFCISVYLILVASMKAHALDRRASDINPIGKTFGACSASQSNPCPRILKGNSIDAVGHSRSVCEMLQSNDRACNVEIPLATGYTVTAGICWAACAGWVQGLPLCKASGLIMSASEIVAMLGLQASNYTKNASSLLENNWGMAGTSAGAAGLGALALWGASAGSEATTLASQIAIAEKTTQSAAEDVAADNAYYDRLSNIPRERTEEGFVSEPTKKLNQAKEQEENLKDQKAQKERDEKNAACFSAIVSGAMAGVKWYDYTAIQASSNENIKKLHKFTSQANQPYEPHFPGYGSHGQDSDLANPQPPTDTAIPNQPELSRGIRNVSSLHKSTSFAEEVNNLPSSAVTAALRNAEPFNRVGTASAAQMARAFDEFSNLTGVKPGTLAQDAQQNGIGKTMQKLLSQFPHVNPNLLAALGSFDSKLNQYLSKQNSTFAFEDTKSILRSQENDHSASNSSCIVSKHNDACKINNSNEQNLSRTPASAVTSKSLTEHQLDELILHKNSSRTIFEIVSDRTQSTYLVTKP